MNRGFQRPAPPSSILPTTADHYRPFNFTAPDWTPLERAIALSGCPADEVAKVCGEFMWMQEEPKGIHNYKHCDTRKYVRLTMHTSAPACARDLEEARRF